MKKVVIDAGHGGTDGGATGNGIVEKELTLEISQYIHERLDELGIQNTMVRTTDETVEPAERVQRIVAPYGSGSDVLVISNHINAGGGQGSEIIYALRNSDAFSKKIADELESMGRNVRKYYQRRYPSDSSKDYYFIHRNTGNTEAVIVEYGFLDNAEDAALLKKYWKDYAEAVVKVIANYLGVPYTYTGTMANENYYVVQKGDSLWSIANKYGLTVAKLKDMNNLSSNMLSVGQKLLVKDESSVTTGATYYTVQAGDTLYGIAGKYGLTVDQLKNMNQLSSNQLSIGQQLLVKEGVTTSEGGEYYIVKSGDTLYSIAKKYGLTIDELKNMNHLTSNTLSIHQQLLVSGDTSSNSTYDTYIVKSGDSLWSIASKNNTTVDKLKDINNLSSNLLSVGQKLLIPKSSISFKTYTVKSGDTLYKIAQEYGTTVTDLINLNQLPTTNLSIGQVLYLP